MLATAADLPFQSPLDSFLREAGPHWFDDWSGQTLWDIRVRAGTQDLSPLFSTVPLAVGDIVEVAHGVVAKLRADRYFFIALPAFSDEAPDLPTDPFMDNVTITDVTHGYGVLALDAADARSLLPRLCSLDFADREFPNNHAAQTSVAATAAIVVRLDSRASRQYLVLVPRGLAAYLWTVFLDVADLRPQLR